MNNYEHIKTGLLIGLVSLSVVLTWKIWTFQPDVAFLDEETTYIPSEAMGEERKLTDVIQPEQMIVHHNFEYALLRPEDGRFLQLIEYVLSAKFEERDLSFEHVSTFPKQVDGVGIEIVYPTSIPTDVFFSLFQLNAEEMSFPFLEIDRLFLYVEPSAGRVHMQMLSSKEQEVFELATTLSVKDFEQFAAIEDERYATAFVMNESVKNIKENIYLPTEPLTVQQLSYTASMISGDFFRQTLFTDPDSVKYYRKSGNEESYTDGNRIIEIRNNGQFMEYNNPVFSEMKDRPNRHIVQSSYEFINGHGGWTGDYYLADWQRTELGDEAVYQLHVNRLPVLYFDGMNQMVLRVSSSGGQTEHYFRPLVDVDTVPIDVTAEIELPSGYDVVEQMERFDLYEREKVEKIKIGYEMFMPSRSFMIVEPKWFVLYDGRWQILQFVEEENEEGALDELE